MPKIVITAEFDSVAEARNFLADRSLNQIHTPQGSASAATEASQAQVGTLAGTATASSPGPTATNAASPYSPTPAAAAAAPSTAATTSAPTAPANGVILAATAADPRATLRDAMNAYMARGHDVAQGRALILEVSGVGKLKEVPDDKVALLTNAFQTR